MINKVILVSGLVWAFAVTGIAADQIVLHDGKILSGTITDEDSNEVTILLAKKMILRIEKFRIQSLSRSSPPPDEKPKSVSVASAVPLLTPKETSTTDKIVHDNAVYFLTKKVELRPLSQAVPDFGNLSGDVSFTGQWAGVPLEQGADVVWGSLVIESTSTATFPQWTLASPSPEEAKKWNEGISQLDKRLTAHLNIYSEIEETASASFLSLRGASKSDLKIKSDHLWSELLSRAEKRRQGLNRRIHRSSPAGFSK